MSESDWKWFGSAGHFCLSGYCRFHLTTKVGAYLISTVGDLFLNDKKEPIGLNDDFYETYVFNCTDQVCDCGCGLPIPDDWTELEGRRSKTAKEAQENHYALCNKYDKITNTKRKVERKCQPNSLS